MKVVNMYLSASNITHFQAREFFSSSAVRKIVTARTATERFLSWFDILKRAQRHAAISRPSTWSKTIESKLANILTDRFWLLVEDG